MIPLGQRFHQLTVLGLGVVPNSRLTHWVCRCDCGTVKTIPATGVRNGNNKSCGCRKRAVTVARNFKHGLSKTHLYRVWRDMHRRCYDPKHASYRFYGARGVTVSPSWHELKVFIQDMQEGYRDGLWIERKDSTGNYENENCCWATKEAQHFNKRSTRRVTMWGRAQPVTVWARELGLNPATIFTRIQTLGWDAEEALTTPVNTAFHPPRQEKSLT